MKTSGSALIRALNYVLKDDFKDCITSYIDDIILASESFESHVYQLNRLFQRLCEYGIKLKLNKTFICKQSISFLGYVISKDGINMDPHRIKAIQIMEKPKNIKQVRSLIGMCNYFWCFIINFASFLEPFRQLLSTKKKWIWDNSYDKQFEKLKECFLKAVVLRHPCWEKKFGVVTDASSIVISAMLYQMNDQNNMRITSECSKGLLKYEQTYSSTELELLAIVKAMERFRPYILGRNFDIVTYHRAIIFMNKCNMSNRHLARWFLNIQEYDFNLKYISGKDNVCCDWMSRNVPMHTFVVNQNETQDHLIIAIIVIEPDNKAATN